MMDLSPEQLSSIRTWANGKSRLEAVRLYGSRAFGTTPVGAAVELAVTVVASGTGYRRESGYDHFFYKVESWQAELTKALGVPAHLEFHEQSIHPSVFSFRLDFSLLLWKREDQTRQDQADAYAACVAC